MNGLGFEACKSDAGVYVRRKEGAYLIYVLVYVDDLVIICKTLVLVSWFKAILRSKFTNHDPGQAMDFLGCQVRRDRENRQLYVICIPKIDALLEKFGVKPQRKSSETTMRKNICPAQLPCMGEGKEALGSKVPLEPGNSCFELIGSLLYIANTTKPDLTQAVGVVSRYRCTPKTSHWHATIRVFH